tara:strand:+ start:420 stop:1349 length:930 start_codon:yes stop_codon:yes gene_type:complete
MKSLFEAVSYYFAKGEAFSYITEADGSYKETNAIYISDLEDGASTFSILMVRGDPGRSLPSFVNPKSRLVKAVHSDDPDDVPGASSHLVISKKVLVGGHHGGRHRAAMERARGVSRALAREFLTSLMARYATDFPDKFVAEKARRSKKEKAEEISYRPTVAFHPQENGSLKKDLEEGRIAGFKLRRGVAEFEGEANEAKIQSLDVQISARIIPTDEYGKVRALIDHVRQAFDQIDFEGLNLELIDDQGHALATTKTVNVDQLDGGGDLRYVKTVPITGLEDPIDDCYAKFYPPILDAGKNAVANEKNWM